MNGYYLMALLYFTLGVVAMTGSSLIRFDVLPAANGLRWPRRHHPGPAGRGGARA